MPEKYQLKLEIPCDVSELKTAVGPKYVARSLVKLNGQLVRAMGDTQEESKAALERSIKWQLLLLIA